MALSILQILLIIVAVVFLVYLAINLAVAIKVIVTTPYMTKKPKRQLKRIFKHYLYHLKMHRFLKMFDFVKWVLIDVFRGKVKHTLFGIWCFTGYFGQGKTLGAVTYALRAREQLAKTGKHLHIYTNFDMQGQDGKITSWEDLLDLPRSTVVIFDEIQSTFTSQRFKDFPIELLWKITQCRKQELCIFASSPVFSRMVIQLRENTDMVITCTNVLGLDRWFTYGFYRAPEYEKYLENPVKLRLSRKWNWSFVASDKDYAMYDTQQIVDRLDIEPKT